MSYKVYIAVVCTMICATCLLVAESGACGGGSADQSTKNLSTTVTIPRKVLKQLISITHKSKGLLALWGNAVNLNRGILFPDPSTHDNKCKADNCLKRTQLINYYNELVIQLRIAEHPKNTNITREIWEEKRNEVEKYETRIIELLRKSILPLLNIAVSSCNNYNTLFQYKIASLLKS